MSILSELKKLTGKQNAKVVSEALPDSLNGDADEKYDFEITFTATENEEGDFVMSSDTPPMPHLGNNQTGRARVYLYQHNIGEPARLFFDSICPYHDQFSRTDLRSTHDYIGTRYCAINMNGWDPVYGDDGTINGITLPAITLYYPVDGDIIMSEGGLRIISNQ